MPEQGKDGVRPHPGHAFAVGLGHEMLRRIAMIGIVSQSSSMFMTWVGGVAPVMHWKGRGLGGGCRSG